jgi:fructokinase
VICFGSLAQRSPGSAVAVESFLQNAPAKSLRIFDVNLRQSFYDQDVLRESFQRAHMVKLNDQELPQVSRLLNLGVGTEEALAKRLLNEYGLLLVCITRGARGSILVSQSQTVEHSGLCVKIADAIGAGDAFTACLAHYYLRGHSLEDLSELANRFASWVATQRGATPPISASQLQDILAGAIR